MRLNSSSVALQLGGVLTTVVLLIIGGCATCTTVPVATNFLPPPTINTPHQTNTATKTTDSVNISTTPIPSQHLTVCLPTEPGRLSSGGVGEYVYQALFDAPIEYRAHQYHPVILERLPAFENGDVKILPITVQANDMVWKDGLDTLLRKGAEIQDCSGKTVEFTGKPICMYQMSVIYRMRQDILWSDGTPLTAWDSLEGFENAGGFGQPTQSYEAVNDYMIRWVGRPGYVNLNQSYPGIFYHPLPRHARKQYNDWGEWWQRPFGWGAFILDEWVAGEYIHLVRNPLYFRAAEGLPRVDEVTFYFIQDPEQALRALLEDRCDIVPAAFGYEKLGKDLLSLIEAESRALYNVAYLRGDLWWLEFGIDTRQDRPDWFSDVRVRQAFGYCIDRQRIVDEVFYGRSEVENACLSSNHPSCAEDGLTVYDYDPEKARKLLDELGWTDRDGDGVRENKAGDPFHVILSFGENQVKRPRIVEMLQQNMSKCGVSVQVQPYQSDEFRNVGPEGVFFGRRFDLVIHKVPTYMESCARFTSAQIPSEENEWQGLNAPGYANPKYDVTCNQLLSTWPGTKDYVDAQHQVQIILSRDLPALPLFYEINVALVRPEVKGFAPELADNELWNIEEIDIVK